MFPGMGKLLPKSNKCKQGGIGGCPNFGLFEWPLNNLAAKINRANAMLSKIRHFGKLKTVKSIYHAIFKFHLNHVLPVWSQNASSI